ncbi:MAG: DNA polymerase III subunit alpha, partial [Gammaproteobacteria bacterium]
DRYGRDAVSQSITFGSMAAKAVVRDVGRVQGKSYGYVDRIAKMIPFELGMTLSKALSDEEALRQQYENDEEIEELLDMALKLEGITRNVGKHAGGVVIAPSALTDFVPLYCDESGGNLVTQFDKDDVESAGLVKFDFLGLRTLTIVDWALKNIQRQLGESLDITRIPLDDAQTFSMMQSGKTTAVFQLESRGMQDLIKRLKPNCFEDIVALVALFRPGPLQSGMVDDFINRKHGRADVAYPHPSLEAILSNTYGVILYQEQVMQIAQVLAGYTLGGADMLRRAMGKKKPEEMAKQREIFLTAWLKTHYPPAFMAAVLSSDMDNTDKIVVFVEECRGLGLTLEAPDVNRSMYPFTVSEHGTVLYGLGAIKGVGEGPVNALVAEREAQGPFIDLFDFCRRVNGKKANRRTIEALIRAGACDVFGRDRAVLLASVGEALRQGEQSMQRAQSGMMDMFSLFEDEQSLAEPHYVDVAAMSEDERLRGERDTLGLFLTGHPVAQHRDFLSRFTSFTLNAAQPNRRGQKSTVAGLIVALRTMKNKRGERMAFLTLDDQTARLEVSVFSDLYDRARHVLQKDEVIIVEGEVQHDDYSGQLKMVAQSVLSLAQSESQFAKRLRLKITESDINKDMVGFVERLESCLGPFRPQALQAQAPGEGVQVPRVEGVRACPVWVEYVTAGAVGTLELGESWRVMVAPELIQQLRAVIASSAVLVDY